MVEPDAERNWCQVIHETLREKEIRLATYVPDKVLIPLINAIEDDAAFTAFATTREEEAVGIVTGAWLGGVRGCVLMQTSGFATIANALASLVVPYQIPLLMLISERGTLGEFNLGQTMACRTMRPVLQAIGVETHTLTRIDELGFILRRAIDQAIATQQPAAFILSPLLTGGKVFTP